MSLLEARRKQAEVKAQRAQKLNPIAERRKAQAQQERGDTFATVAEEWFAKQQASATWVDGGKRIRHYLADLFPVKSRLATSSQAAFFMGESGTWRHQRKRRAMDNKRQSGEHSGEQVP